MANGVQGSVRHLMLPGEAASAITYIAVVTRFTRTSMLDTLGEDFVGSHTGKGRNGTGGPISVTRFAIQRYPSSPSWALSLSTAIGGVVMETM